MEKDGLPVAPGSKVWRMFKLATDGRIQYENLFHPSSAERDAGRTGVSAYECSCTTLEHAAVFTRKRAGFRISVDFLRGFSVTGEPGPQVPPIDVNWHCTPYSDEWPNDPSLKLAHEGHCEIANLRLAKHPAEKAARKRQEKLKLLVEKGEVPELQEAYVLQDGAAVPYTAPCYPLP